MNTRADNYLETLYLPSARDKYIECEDSRVLTVWELCISHLQEISTYVT